MIATFAHFYVILKHAKIVKDSLFIKEKKIVITKLISMFVSAIAEIKCSISFLLS